MSVYISDSSVPQSYIDVADLGETIEYVDMKLSKYDFDEKDIRRIKYEDKTIGFLIPAVALVSAEHDWYDDKYFRLAANYLYEKYLDSELDDRMYYIVAYSEVLDEKGFGLDELVLNLYLYGVFIFNGEHVESKNIDYKDLNDRNLKLSRSFPVQSVTGFFGALLMKFIKREENMYSRFMYLYQFFELSMDITFYLEVERCKSDGRGIHDVRTRLADLSSERKLMAKVFLDFGMTSYFEGLRTEVNDLLGSDNGKNYLKADDVSLSDVIYDFRNVVVHSYYRSHFDDSLKVIVSSVQEIVITMIAQICSDNGIRDFKDEFERRFVSTGA